MLYQVSLEERLLNTRYCLVSNPGFDIVNFEQSTDDTRKAEPIVICAECRFSDPASTTSQNKDEIKNKRSLTVAQFRPYFEEGKQLDGHTVKEENLFLVVCAFRDVNNNVSAHLPQNTIVLDRDMLKTLYTPSLAARPQFILPLKEGESTKMEDVGKDAADLQL